MTPRWRSAAWRCRVLALVSAKSGVAFPKLSSVTISSVASTASAGEPCALRIPAIKAADINSPRLASVSMARGVTSRTSEKPEQRCSKVSTCSASLGKTVACSPAGRSWSATSRCRLASSWRTLFQCSRSPRLASWAARISMSVTPPIAETTTTASASARSRTISAARRMRSPSPTEVPPNFMTISGFLPLACVKTCLLLCVPFARASHERCAARFAPGRRVVAPSGPLSESYSSWKWIWEQTPWSIRARPR